MNEERTAILEWEGVEYELTYTFSIVRRLRAVGIKVPRIFYAIQEDRNAAMDYADDICYCIAWLLREAGAKGVTDESVWRWVMADQAERLKIVLGLFFWICGQHFAGSKETAPAKKKSKKKKRKAT